FTLSRQLDTTDLTAVADFFRSNKCLLILDNFETPAHSDSKRMQQFFQAFVAEPGVGSILVLAMRGHHAPRIDVNSTTFVQVSIGTLKEDKEAATNTFCHFYENGRDPQHVAVTQDILSCLDYHPLSIRLFALRARHDPFSSAAVLLEKWQHQASAVLSQNADGRDGTPTLEISLGFSLMSPVLQELPGSSLALSFLSWSPDGLLLLDLEGLLDGDYRPLVAILDVGLADEVPGLKRRLRMLAPVRKYVNELVLRQINPFLLPVTDSLQPLANCLLIKAQERINKFDGATKQDALLEFRDEYVNLQQVVFDSLLHLPEMNKIIEEFVLKNSNILYRKRFNTMQLLQRMLSRTELSIQVMSRLRFYLGQELYFQGYTKEALTELLCPSHRED
ncbi:hypothetical protein BT69DRAFT_1397254, partial [Atractiella rhizophila]